MFSSPFQTETKVSIPDEADIIFVSDLFSSDHLGGAELTTDAIIDSSPYKVFRLHSKDVNEPETLQQGLSRHWIFGNFTGMNLELLPSIIANMKYSVVEYDYKYCKYRSPEKHLEIENKECDCSSDIHGKMISAFYFGAKSLVVDVRKTDEAYTKIYFPFFLKERILFYHLYLMKISLSFLQNSILNQRCKKRKVASS